MGLALVNITSGPLLPLAHIYQTPTLMGGRRPGGGLADTKLVTTSPGPYIPCLSSAPSLVQGASLGQESL